MKIRLGWIVPACALAFLGCGGSGDNLPRQAVSGTVTYDGQPIKEGRINFTPSDPNMKDPVFGGSPIKDGKYSIAKDVGLVPGKYNVSISASSGDKAGDDAPGSSKGLPKEMLPAKYNVKSTLTADVGTGKEPIDFKLDK
ncbi:MAG: hypothetical protein U0800_11275 [Isosphaeraceae bacterium]